MFLDNCHKTENKKNIINNDGLPIVYVSQINFTIMTTDLD